MIRKEENLIPFNLPPKTGNEQQYILEAINSDQISGDGRFSKKCHAWFEEVLNCEKALLTPSCTHALELAAILLEIAPGDEVIMPSYTFVSTANAFVLRGAKIIFVDIRPDTMNLDQDLIEAAISDKTKAIVPVHYGGVACDMDTIMDIADRYGLYVVEDAAQGMLASYKRKALGSFGHLGAYSFHETKNFTSGGEGGLLIVNDKRFVDRAHIIREKGTNRTQYFAGVVDKYSWIDIGSSYLMNEISAAYLWGQLEKSSDIHHARLKCWQRYYTGLKQLQRKGLIELPCIPRDCSHNAHLFYIKVKDYDERTQMLAYLEKRGINAVFHYVPLHSALAGLKYGEFRGKDVYTTRESERLIRLPMYYGLREKAIDKVIHVIHEYYET